MHQSASRRDGAEPLAPRVARHARYIYIACPWTPMGGGMYKVADYLIQSQAQGPLAQGTQLRPLDTRGGKSALSSLWFLLIAIAKITKGAFGGRLAGVHVNMAERMSLFRKGTVVVVCSALGVPSVLHLHAQMHGFYGRLPAALRGLTRWIFSLAEVVIVIGPAARAFVTEVLRVPPDRVRIVINGVPEPVRASERATERYRQHILFLANLSDRKGLSDLLQALAQPVLDKSRLAVTIAGGGDIARYQVMARELAVGDVVRFEGWCDQKKVSDLLADCDLLVLPSHDEVLPLAILEALAHKVAVVTTAVGEIPSLLTHGVDAVFVAVGDPVGLAAAMHKVLEEPILRDALRNNGRALYERSFCLSRFFANVAGIHQRCFGAAGHLKEGLLLTLDSQKLEHPTQDHPA